MSNVNTTSYVCSRCGVSSDNREQAIIHAKGPLHAGASFSELYPNSHEAEKMQPLPAEKKKQQP